MGNQGGFPPPLELPTPKPEGRRPRWGCLRGDSPSGPCGRPDGQPMDGQAVHEADHRRAHTLSPLRRAGPGGPADACGAAATNGAYAGKGGGKRRLARLAPVWGLHWRAAPYAHGAWLPPHAGPCRVGCTPPWRPHLLRGRPPRTPGRREAVGAITIGNQGKGGITPGAYFRASQAVPAALTRSP